MKYIKDFKIFETGEWSKDVDWDFVKENPDDESEEAMWIKSFEYKLNYLISLLDDENVFEIEDIRGFDMYQGPYGRVKIFNRKYKVVEIEHPYEGLFIFGFPVDNSEEGNYDGYHGNEEDIANLLNDINSFGGDIDLYKNSNKYNL